MDRYHLGASWHNPKPPPPPEKNGRRAPSLPVQALISYKTDVRDFKSRFLYLSVCPSVCWFVCLSVSPSLFQSLSLLLMVSQWMCFFLGMFLLILSVCLFVYLSLCLAVSVTLSTSIFLSTPVHVHTCLPVLAPELHCGPTPWSLRFPGRGSSFVCGR